MMTNLIRTVFGLTLVSLAAVIIFAGCNGNGSVLCDNPAVDSSGVPELQDRVLSIGSELGFEPMNFIDTETAAPDGFEIDFAHALADELCVDVEFVETSFDLLLDRLDDDSIDVIIASMTITEQRERRADFTPYIQVGSAILVRSGNPSGIEKREGLCGLTVAVQSGTIQLEMLNLQNGRCAVEVKLFDTADLAGNNVRDRGSNAALVNFDDARRIAEQLEALDGYCYPNVELWNDQDACKDARYGILVPPGTGLPSGDPAVLCSLTVAVEVPSGADKALAALCPLDLHHFRTDDLAAASVSDGRSDASVMRLDVAAAMAADGERELTNVCGEVPCDSDLGILVRTSDARGVSHLKDLCSLTIGIRSALVASRLRKECSMDILQFGTHDATMLDLTVSGSEASITDFPVAFLAAQDSNGRLKLVEGQFEQEDYGIGTRKSSPELAAALKAALDNLICAEDYDALLEAWNLLASHRFDEDGDDSPDCPS
jgi:polar amino acid transport system substrate-binding protein